LFQKLKNIYHLLQALIANSLYDFPGKKLIVIGVTGTDGKSTVSNLIYQVLVSSGKKAGVISTIGCRINGREYNIGLHTTTPSAFTIQKLLRGMLKEGCEYAVLEVASHGIDQQRIWGIPFEIGVLTNVTREHLDYHKTFENYENVKLKFLKKAKIRVLNYKFVKYMDKLDDGKFITTYCIGQGDYQANQIQKGCFSLSIVSEKNPREVLINHNFLGEFNVENILASVTTCHTLGIELNQIINSIAGFKGIKGRLEEIVNDKKLHVFVDFAHTPNALEQVLGTLKKEFPESKLIHVFGATGKRDMEKRPIMGEVSGRKADISILTTEDTYGENRDQIITMIENGIKLTSKEKNITYFIEPDRKEALVAAFNFAKENDVIVATGVGHQTTLNVGHEIEWSDQEEIKKILSNKINQ
jgi:UDP-N-acetylmuramoyl-L-alanyl-D-glutamate--2,6-diaminopimelate ligase